MRSQLRHSAAALIVCGLLTASACSPSRDWHAELAQASDDRDRQIADLDAWRDRELATCDTTPDAAACRHQVWDQYLERVKAIWHSHLAEVNRIFDVEPADSAALELSGVR